MGFMLTQEPVISLKNYLNNITSTLFLSLGKCILSHLLQYLGESIGERAVALENSSQHSQTTQTQKRAELMAQAYSCLSVSMLLPPNHSAGWILFNRCLWESSSVIQERQGTYLRQLGESLTKSCILCLPARLWCTRPSHSFLEIPTKPA